MVVVNLAILLAELRGRRAAKREPLVRPALLQEATELDLEVTRSLLREFREVTTQELHVRR